MAWMEELRKKINYIPSSYNFTFDGIYIMDGEVKI
jgi:hypothetical protein